MLASVPLLFALDATVTLADRTEIRGRVPATEGPVAVDIETTPEARLRFASRGSDVSLRYAPRIAVTDLAAGQPPDILHSGGAAASFRSRRARLDADESLSYGRTAFTSLAQPTGGTAPQVAPLPTTGTLQVVSSVTTLTGGLALRLWRLGATLGLQGNGGADAASRASLPFEHGPFARASLERALTREATFVFRSYAQETQFSSGPEIALVQGEQGFRRTLGRRLTGEVTLGGAAAKVVGAASRGYAVGEASLAYRSATHGEPLAAKLAVRVAPVLNLVLGVLDERLEGTFGGSWSRPPSTHRASVTLAQTLPSDGPTAVRLFLGELATDYRVQQHLHLDLGLRVLAQEQAELPAAGSATRRVAYAQAGLFFGMTYQGTPLRL